MTTTRRFFTPLIGVVLTLLLATTTGIAQSRLTIPSGSVLEIRTETELSSDKSHTNDVFNSTVTKSLWIDGAIAVPENSAVRGHVTSVTPAARRDPGIIGVAFDQLTINGRNYVIDGSLTSVDATERKQIIDQESHVQGGSTTKRDVVFIGGGAGAGAVIGAIAGGGKGAGIGALAGGAIGALGALLSPGKQAKVAAGSVVGMELLRPVTLTGNDRITRNRGANDRSIYTSANMVRNAQTELKRRNYYSGVVNGQLDDATRRSIAHFQIDNGQSATGDLDENTLGTLGVMQGRGRGLASVDTRQLSLELSQKATSLLSIYQSNLGLRATTGGFAGSGSRLYSEADLKLLLDVNSFVTASTWYEQASRQGNANSPSLDNLGRILASSARDVETSMQAASQNTQFRDSWANIRADLRRLRLDGQLSNR